MRKTTIIMIGAIVFMIVMITVAAKISLQNSIAEIHVTKADDSTTRMYLPESSSSYDSLIVDIPSYSGGSIFPIRLNIYPSTSDSSYIEMPTGWFDSSDIQTSIDNQGKRITKINLMNQLMVSIKNAGSVTELHISNDTVNIDMYLTAKSPHISFDQYPSTYTSLNNFQGNNVTLCTSGIIRVENCTLSQLTLLNEEWHGVPIYIDNCDIDSLVLGQDAARNHFEITDRTSIKNIIISNPEEFPILSQVNDSTKVTYTSEE